MTNASDNARKAVASGKIAQTDFLSLFRVAIDDVEPECVEAISVARRLRGDNNGLLPMRYEVLVMQR